MIACAHGFFFLENGWRQGTQRAEDGRGIQATLAVHPHVPSLTEQRVDSRKMGTVVESSP